jgi:flagellar hook assembly protein FlgD
VAEDHAGNQSTFDRHVVFDNVQITDISRTPIEFLPTLGDRTTISYSLDRQARVTFKLFDEATDAPVKTFASGEVQGAGAYEYTWDGKTEGGILLPLNGAYYFTIEAQDGTGRIDQYIPPIAQPFSSGFNHVSFNPYRNELLPITFSLQAAARQSLDVKVGGQIVHNLVSSEPFLEGEHKVYWDGRDAGGNLLPKGTTYSIILYQPFGLPENVIITREEALKIDHLRAEAYLIRPGYGEVSRVTYDLPQEAYLTLKIKDPRGNPFKTLIDHELKQARSYELFWDGTNASGLHVSVPGNYTLEFYLENPSRTQSRYRRGNVVVVK